MSEDSAVQDTATPRWGPGQLVQRQETGWYWHVVARLVDVDTGTVRYEIADPTHTRTKILHEADATWEFESTGVRIDSATKPASVFGERVEGILYGYSDVPHQPVEEA